MGCEFVGVGVGVGGGGVGGWVVGCVCMCVCVCWKTVGTCQNTCVHVVGVGGCIKHTCDSVLVLM